MAKHITKSYPVSVHLQTRGKGKLCARARTKGARPQVESLSHNILFSEANSFFSQTRWCPLPHYILLSCMLSYLAVITHSPLTLTNVHCSHSGGNLPSPPNCNQVAAARCHGDCLHSPHWTEVRPLTLSNKFWRNHNPDNYLVPQPCASICLLGPAEWCPGKKFLIFQICWLQMAVIESYDHVMW